MLTSTTYPPSTTRSNRFIAMCAPRDAVLPACWIRSRANLLCTHFSMYKCYLLRRPVAKVPQLAQSRSTDNENGTSAKGTSS